MEFRDHLEVWELVKFESWVPNMLLLILRLFKFRKLFIWLFYIYYFLMEKGTWELIRWVVFPFRDPIYSKCYNEPSKCLGKSHPKHKYHRRIRSLIHLITFFSSSFQPYLLASYDLECTQGHWTGSMWRIENRLKSRFPCLHNTFRINGDFIPMIGGTHL